MCVSDMLFAEKITLMLSPQTLYAGNIKTNDNNSLSLLTSIVQCQRNALEK